ncbi:MAG: hypothetical protein KBT29_00110 [Prevotellaceae bacterium]|nr:hypothetical protein [Candidatus Minthosoma caballi]
MKTNTLYNIYSIIAGSIIATSLLASCSEDVAETSLASSATAVVSDFTPAEKAEWGLAVRSAIDPTTNPISFSWSEGDKLAIYAGNGDGMTNFNISTIDGKNAKFKATGFNLKNGETYHAFFPYNADCTNKSNVAVSYNGMTQSGNGTYDHLGTYDYQIASATATGAAEAANISYEFNHAGVVCRFQLSGLPQLKYSSFSISAPGVITKGEMNLTDIQPAITAAADNVEKQVIKLGNDGLFPNEGSLTIYCMMAPANLSDKTVTLNLYSGKSDMAIISLSVNGKNMEAGKAYGYSAAYLAPTPPVDLGYVDLGLELSGEPIYFANKNFYIGDVNTFAWTDIDPVSATWGPDWRTPTREELETLFNKQVMDYPLTWEYSEVLGGVWVINNVMESEIGESGKHRIFLPVVDGTGDYWSSKLNNGSYAWYCEVDVDDYEEITNSESSISISKKFFIRPVYVGNK